MFLVGLALEVVEGRELRLGDGVRLLESHALAPANRHLHALRRAGGEGSSAGRGEASSANERTNECARWRRGAEGRGLGAGAGRGGAPWPGWTPRRSRSRFRSRRRPPRTRWRPCAPPPRTWDATTTPRRGSARELNLARGRGRVGRGRVGRGRRRGRRRESLDRISRRHPARGRSVKIAWGSFASPSTGESECDPARGRGDVSFVRCDAVPLSSMSAQMPESLANNFTSRAPAAGEGASGRGLLDAAALHSV